MFIFTLFSSIFSLFENTLGLKYQVTIEGERRGGSPYYILYGLKNKKLSFIFSLILVLSSIIFFLPIQIKGITFSIKNLININYYIIFITLIIFSFIFIFRGTNIIAKIINKIVPIMTSIFLFVCFYAIIIKYNQIYFVIKLILKSAFNFKSYGISMIIIGLKRSLFSNEAGLGTAPSINCYSNNKPIRQGYLQVLTCFIDTIVMCIMLGFVILLYNIDLNIENSDSLSILIFENIFPKIGKYIGNFLLFIFSLATVVSSYYAGETNILFNNVVNKKINVNILKTCYKMLFIIGIFLGVFFSNSNLWNLVDYGLVFLGIINIYAIIKLENRFNEEIK